MDLFQLKLELIDFSKCSNARWRFRRVFIGYLLSIYYVYAFLFFFMVAVPEYDLFGFDGQSSRKAQQEVNQTQLLKETTPPEKTTETVNKPDKTGKIINQTKTVEEELVPPLLLMVTFGFIGGVFFITRTFVRTTQNQVGDGGTIERKDVSVSWYLTRPLQSALMAIFIYYAFRAGQLVFYSMEGAPGAEQINVYVLSLLAIIAGAFSEQAFEKLHDIASRIFRLKEAEITPQSRRTD